jgi:hypothetical protein
MQQGYRRIWKQHTGLKIPSGWHIHHIDGDHTNNAPENLNCVSPTMHWWAHYLRGDIVACQGRFIQGAVEAGRLGGAWSVASGQLASIRTEENQAKGRRSRDPAEHRETSRRAGLENVASGVLAKARALSPILYNKEWARRAGRIGGNTNKGKRHMTNIKTGEDRRIPENQMPVLLATGDWRLGRSRGGWNTFNSEVKREIHSAGGKARWKCDAAKLSKVR